VLLSIPIWEYSDFLLITKCKFANNGGEMMKEIHFRGSLTLALSAKF